MKGDSFGKMWGGLFRGKTKSPIQQPPDLSQPVRIPYGAFRFKVEVPKGVEFQVLGSTDLKTWLPLGAEKAATENPEYVDSTASRYTFRFYRLVVGEVFSRQILGYAGLTVPPGFSMIANPFRCENPSVSALFPNVPDGTMLHKFDNQLFRLTENLVQEGKWLNPSHTLNPGEGAIYFNPTSDFTVVNLTGEVPHGKLLNPIPSGFSIRSSMVPQAGRLNVDLGFPVVEGDVIHQYDRDQQKYLIHTYDPARWERDPPVIGVGESFWVGKTAPSNWIQEFDFG
jgi:hypothetical protein